MPKGKRTVLISNVDQPKALASRYPFL